MAIRETALALLLILPGLVSCVPPSAIDELFMGGVAVSASQSSVSVSASTVDAGQSITVKVTPRDQNGNSFRLARTLSIAFSTTGGTSVGSWGSATDAGDGTYSATFTGVTPGTATRIVTSVEGTVLSATPEVQVTASAPPGAFAISSAAVTASGTVRLSWGTATGATSYTVKYGTTSGTYGTTVSTSATAPFDVTGLTGNTTYYFMVTAVNGLGSTDATAEASAQAIGSFSISSLADIGAVQLSWGAAAGAASYSVKYGTSSGNYPTTTACAASGCTISGLTDGTTYYFMVYATNSSGTAAASAEATATPPGTPNLLFSGPATSNTGYCTSAFTVASRYGLGTALPVSSSLTVSLSGGSGSLFYSDSSCSTPVTTVQIPASSSSATFYSKSNIAQTASISGTATSYTATPASVANTAIQNRIDLFAGTTTGAGNDDGTGTGASFFYPRHMAIYTDTGTSTTYLYIVDYGNNRIRVVNLTSAYSTGNYTASHFAGSTSGASGTADGNSTTARFKGPLGVAVDSSGNLYVSDYANHTIRKITQAGNVSTIAGGVGSAGYTDATGTSARFRNPRGVAVDPTSTYLYVADGGNHAIRKIDLSTFAVTTLAGSSSGTSGFNDGTGSAALFNTPSAVAADSTYVYVADSGNARIRKIQISDGSTSTIAGQTTTGTVNGSLGANQLNTAIYQMFLSGTTLYIVDSGNSHTIRTLDLSTGYLGTIAGMGYSVTIGDADSTTGTTAHFFSPEGIAGDANYLYVSDNTLNTVRRISRTSPNAVTTVLGPQSRLYDSPSSDPFITRFSMLDDVAQVGDDLYGPTHNMYLGNHIFKISLKDGSSSIFAGSGTLGFVNGIGTAAQFYSPRGICYNGTSLYVLDYSNYVIREINPSTAEVTTFAGTGANGYLDGSAASAKFGGMTGLGCDSGAVYVGETYRIRKIDIASLTVSTLTGSTGSATGYVDDTAANTRFSVISGKMYSDGNYLYSADSGNCAIRKTSLTDGSTTTLAGGGPSSCGLADGVGAAALFNRPFGVTGDGAGNLYVFDRSNGQIRKIVISSATVTKLLTNSNNNTEVDGLLTTARLTGLASFTYGLLWTTSGIFLPTGWGLRWIH